VAGSATTIGNYVRGLIDNVDYYSTILPRLPVMVQREMKVKVLQEEENYHRSKNNLDICDKEFVTGAKVRGLYADEENPLQWYDAIIDEVVQPKEEWESPTYWVTFTEYGNNEVLKLGEIEPSYMNSGVAGGYDAVMEQERRKAQSTGKNYARQVLGMKSSMALKKDTGLGYGGSEMEREQLYENRKSDMRGGNGNKGDSSNNGNSNGNNGGGGGGNGGGGDSGGGGGGAFGNNAFGNNKRNREQSTGDIETARAKKSKLISKYG